MDLYCPDTPFTVYTFADGTSMEDMGDTSKCVEQKQVSNDERRMVGHVTDLSCSAS